MSREIFSAEIVKRIGDSNSLFKVKVERNECGVCSLKSKCTFYSGPQIVTAYSKLSQLNPGQQVLISINPKYGLLATTLFYLIPSVLLVVIIIIGAMLRLADWKIMLLFVLIFGIYLLIISRLKWNIYPEIIGLKQEISRD